MYTDILHKILLKRPLKMSGMKSLVCMIMVILVFPQQKVFAQDLHLQNSTIADSVTYSAEFITAGPNITITGDVMLSAEKTAIIAPFFIVGNGQLKVISGDIPSSISITESVLPEEFYLDQNSPNPFNPETEIRFGLKKDSDVVITIFNTLGQNIKILTNKRYSAGLHSVRWDGKDIFGNIVSSGMYLYKIQAGQFVDVKKMNLIK